MEAEGLTRHLWIVAGSVCKDWSSMGSQQGFTGAYVTLCAIMLAVTKRLQPLCLVHECTRLFPFSVFETVLTNHVDHHMILECQNFGAPVKRGRAYDVIVRKDHILVGGLDSLWRLARRCTLDASVWLQASDAEAHCPTV